METSEVKTQKITLSNGETINVHISGGGEEVLVMLPGMLLDHRCLTCLFPYLEENFTIIAPDFRGCGQSSYETPIKDASDIIEDISLLINHLELKKINIFGWCFGASIALKYTSQNPEKVNKIIIMAPEGLEGFPFFLPDGNKEHIEKREQLTSHVGFQMLDKAAKENDKERMIKILEKGNIGRRNPDPQVLSSLADQLMSVRNIWDLCWAAYTINLTEHKKWITEGSGDILKIQNKVLLIYAEDETLIPKIALNQFSEYLGDKVTVKIFKDGDHGLHLLHSKEISKDISEFILSF